MKSTLRERTGGPALMEDFLFKKCVALMEEEEEEEDEEDEDEDD